VRRFGESVVVARQDGLFNEHRVVRFERLDEPLRHRLGDAAVEVDADSDLVADGLSNLSEARRGGVDGGRVVDPLYLFGRVHLQRRKPRLDLFSRLFGHVGRAIAADPLVHSDPLSRRAAE